MKIGFVERDTVKRTRTRGRLLRRPAKSLPPPAHSRLIPIPLFRMRRAFLILLFIGWAIATAEPTALEREQTLTAELATLDPTDVSPAAEQTRTDYATLLTFTLERDFATALDLWESLLARARLEPPTDEARLATLEHGLAHARFYLGQPAERVEPLLFSSLARRRTVFGETSPEVLHTRQDLATYYGRTGRPDLAETENRAVALAFDARDPDSDDALRARTDWAITLGRLGRWPETEAILRDVITRRTALLGADHPDLTNPLNLLCWVLFSTGRFDETVPLMERIVALRTASFGADASTTLVARYNLASIYERTGRLDDAEAIIRADLARSEARSDPGWHEPASYHERLGDFALRRGDGATAVTEYEAALTRYRQAPEGGWRDTDSRTLEKTLYAYARAQAAAGAPTGARATATEALGLLEQEFQRRLGYTSEAERLAFAAQERPFDLPATLDDAPLLARAVVRLHGLILESLIEDAALAERAHDPVTAALLADYRETLAGANASSAADVRDDALGLSPLEQLEKDLTARLGGSRLPREALRVDPAAVLAALPSDAALIHYVRYRPLTVTGDAEGDEARARYLAPLGLPDGSWQMIDLGEAATIDDLVARYQILTTDGGPISWAEELRVVVLDPVRAALPLATARLYVVPDSALHRVNFASLPEADGKTFAVQHHQFVWLNSARDLVAPVNASPVGTTGEIRILAAPTLDGELGGLPELPGAAAEAAAVQRHLSNALVLTGENATPDAALALPAPRILHIAAHGLWALDGADHQAALTRAGIALAGPNGFLSAARISASDLSGTALVVISACNSGAGPVADGEGVLGLRRALARAGAHQTMVALWPLDDAAAADLFDHFYAAWPAGELDLPAAYQSALGETLTAIAARDGPSAALRRAGALISVGRP